MLEPEHPLHGPEDDLEHLAEVESGRDLGGDLLDDAAVVAVIEKMLKQRRDSIVQYEAAHRQDLADAEKYEMEGVRSYMPQALSDSEVECAVAEAISAAGARGQQDMGRVMALLKPRLSGRADMSKVSALVKTRLAV